MGKYMGSVIVYKNDYGLGVQVCYVYIYIYLYVCIFATLVSSASFSHYGVWRGVLAGGWWFVDGEDQSLWSHVHNQYLGMT